MYTGGFSHCPNGTLALGTTTIFYHCRWGGFYNLYDRWCVLFTSARNSTISLRSLASSAARLAVRSISIRLKVKLKAFLPLSAPVRRPSSGRSYLHWRLLSLSERNAGGWSNRNLRPVSFWRLL
ncbi:hypothetical protein QBC37DRAFT_420491, partial [Rhypophila decipiens]